MNYSLISWNVNGIRASYKKGFKDWLLTENPDIFCAQETKANVICIELMTFGTQTLRKNLTGWFGVYDHDEAETYVTNYRKNGFSVIPNKGYDQIFIVDVDKIGNPKFNIQSSVYGSSHLDLTNHFDNLEAKDEEKGLTTRQLKTALNKNQSVKNNRKFMASRLVDIMSEYQSVEDRKKKIELSLDISSDVRYNEEEVPELSN